jgi:glucose-1-phosphate thymidylyltransferase
MIYYPLSILIMAGIYDVMIISTPEDIVAYQRLLEDGSRFGINLKYKVQEQPKGLAEAFVLGADFIRKDPVCLILGIRFF